MSSAATLPGERRANQPSKGVGERHFPGFEHGGEARIGREAWIGVDLEHEEPAGRIDAEIHARVAAELEQLPALPSDARRGGGEGTIHIEAAHGPRLLAAAT